MNIDVGQVIAGKYELQRLLGKGAMGEVWLATHNSLGGEFAIKLVEPTDDIEAETAAGRFQLEAQIAAKLSRKTRHIVSVSDHGEENGLAYLVMELLEGESLEQRTKRVGQMDLPDVAAIVTQVARALSLAHEEGIFHRDLKPANVWLSRDEDGRLLVKLLDFGIARSKKPFRTRSPFATSKDMVLGTPSYMSPEQARGLETLDYRCDLWALAVVAYEALTRKIPFEGETVEDIFLSICTFRVVPALTRRPDLPPAIEVFFQRAFAPKLDDRYTGALELSETFEQLVTPESLEAALGIQPAPSTLRAMRRSDPNYRSGADLAQFAPQGTGNVRVGSSPDFDNVAIGGDVYGARRNGAGGWLLAIAGIVAILGIGILLLVTFRTPSRSSATSFPSPSGTASNPAPPTSTTLTAGSTTAPTLTAEPAPPQTAKPFTATRPRPQPQVAPKPAPPPAPTPAKPVNKGEVF